MLNCDVICGSDEKWCGVPSPPPLDGHSILESYIEILPERKTVIILVVGPTSVVD